MKKCPNCGKSFLNTATFCDDCNCSLMNRAESTISTAQSSTINTESYFSVSQLKFTARPNNTSGPCVGSTIMTILAGLTWLCGFVVAFTFSNDARGNFQLPIFCAWVIGFGIAGGLQFALGELMQNVASIAASLREMKIEQINI